MAARPATAQELEKIRQAAGIESASLGAAAPAQLLTGLRLTGERYAEGPGLGKTETIGEASLLKGLAAEEAYAYPRVPTYLKKTKRKQARASTRIEY
ncbi:MAG TPA: hypothetical protein VN317_01185 [Candidatus Methanoperedens sp.]|nr:hypothetical protein [Candidatus Methanoperedens sp.]